MFILAHYKPIFEYKLLNYKWDYPSHSYQYNLVHYDYNSKGYESHSYQYNILKYDYKSLYS